jgi:hypothetical protein
MQGVVVWSNAEKASAVIWCEDHARLAYLQGQGSLQGAAAWPLVGDLARFETVVLSGIRYARAFSVLVPEACPQLPAALQQAAAPKHRVPALRLCAAG